MSVKNFVQCGLITPITATTSELVLNAPASPYQYPPLDGGTLVIADSPARPSYYEVISYTHRIDNVLYNVVRGKEGSAARNWSGTAWVYQALTAQDYVNALALKAPLASPALTGTPTAPTAAAGTNTTQIATMAALQTAIANLIDTSPAALNTLNELAAALGDDPNFAATMTSALAGKEPTIAAGTTAQYWRGDKSWQTLLTAIHNTLLTGLGAGSNSSILATDNILAAMAKLQNQMNNKAASTDARLNDARDWTATEVSQAEAEAGVATTARKWTAQRVAQAVRGGLLTGLNLSLNSVITASDTVLSALGKLQKQISDAAANLAGSVRATVLSGYVEGANTALADTDTVEGALGKVQGQLNNKLNTTGNAASATKLATARTIALSGDVSGSGSFDGSGNLTIAATVADDSHAHTIANVDGLQTALNGKSDTSHTHGYWIPDTPISGWYRSTGNVGWYSETYGGGVHMVDATYVRLSHAKALYVSNAIVATGNITAYYSDERLKENIRPITHALAGVNSLQGVRYNANALAESYGYNRAKEEVGLLAQDVQQIMPEAVEPAPFDIDGETGGSLTGENYLTLKYERLVPLLIEAIKELDAKVQRLEAR